MFTCALLVTSFALVANESVFLVCSTWLKAGLMVHIIAVRAFPPSDDCKIRVSFESLYGTWALLLPPLQIEKSLRQIITLQLNFHKSGYISVQEFSIFHKKKIIKNLIKKQKPKFSNPMRSIQQKLLVSLQLNWFFKNSYVQLSSSITNCFL